MESVPMALLVEGVPAASVPVALTLAEEDDDSESDEEEESVEPSAEPIADESEGPVVMVARRPVQTESAVFYLPAKFVGSLSPEWAVLGDDRDEGPEVMVARHPVRAGASVYSVPVRLLGSLLGHWVQLGPKESVSSVVLPAAAAAALVDVSVDGVYDARRQEMVTDEFADIARAIGYAMLVTLEPSAIDAARVEPTLALMGLLRAVVETGAGSNPDGLVGNIAWKRAWVAQQVMCTAIVGQGSAPVERVMMFRSTMCMSGAELDSAFGSGPADVFEPVATGTLDAVETYLAGGMVRHVRRVLWRMVLRTMWMSRNLGLLRGAVLRKRLWVEHVSDVKEIQSVDRGAKRARVGA